MDVFTQKRIGERARRLSLSQLSCMGRHTITGLLCSNGRQFVDWSADYRFFSKDKWQPQQLFGPIIEGVLNLLPEGAPFVTALDDTHLRKTGTKIPGVAYRRDPLSPKFNCNLIRAQRYLQLSAQAYTQTNPTAARALPIRFEHSPSVPKPKHTASPEEWADYRKECRQKNLSTHAVAMLQETREQLDQKHQAQLRELIVSTDGSYTNKTVLRGLPQHTILIGRFRKDASLFYPLSPEDQASRGTRRQYGQPAPTPEQVRTDDTIPWQEIKAVGPGGLHTFRIKTLSPVFWKKAGAKKPLQLVVIAPVGYRLRKGSRLLFRKPAYLICTDLKLSLAKVVQYYLWRWDIEVNHRDEKQLIGVGQAQVWSPQSVERQPAFAVASYAMLLLATIQAFGLEATQAVLPPPKWRIPKTMARISTQRSLQQLHSEVWSYVLNVPEIHCNDFLTMDQVVTKCPESQLPLASTVLYVASG